MVEVQKFSFAHLDRSTLLACFHVRRELLTRQESGKNGSSSLLELEQDHPLVQKHLLVNKWLTRISIFLWRFFVSTRFLPRGRTMYTGTTLSLATTLYSICSQLDLNFPVTPFSLFFTNTWSPILTSTCLILESYFFLLYYYYYIWSYILRFTYRHPRVKAVRSFYWRPRNKLI